MNRTPRIFAVASVAGLLFAACGDDDTRGSGEGADSQTVEIEMVDIAFEPASLEVEAGVSVRFVFTNSGEIAHDAFIGDEAAQDAHEMEMREAEEEGHGGGHDDDAAEDAITVEPGDTGELTHTFKESGEILIGCHQAGHYEAGMIVNVTVA